MSTPAVPDLAAALRAKLATLRRRRCCDTCGGAGEVRCEAHIAGDGCIDMRFTCPDCLTEEGGQ